MATIPTDMGFELTNTEPLDPRLVREDIAARDALVTNLQAYEGMEVYVKSEKKKYKYTGVGWDEIGTDELVKKADIKTTTLDENATNDEIYGGKAIFDAIIKNCVGKETVLYNGTINATGTYTLADDVNNYDFIIITTYVVGAYQTHMIDRNAWTSANPSNNVQINHGNAASNYYVNFRLSGINLSVIDIGTMIITSIVGYKFGQVTVQNTINNPSIGKSYSLDEQLTGGTWIDGKPIYRKVIVSTFGLSANSLKQLTLSSFGVNNVETPISCVLISDNGGSVGIRTNGGVYPEFFTNAINIRTPSGWALSSGVQRIIIEYTKTTDA